MLYKRIQFNKSNYNIKPHLQGFLNSLKTYNNTWLNGTCISTALANQRSLFKTIHRL